MLVPRCKIKLKRCKYALRSKKEKHENFGVVKDRVDANNINWKRQKAMKKEVKKIKVVYEVKIS